MDVQNSGQISPLLRLPLEIIELIVLNILCTSTLLSAGLSSRVLAKIIFPRHLQYHTVRTSLLDVKTWQHLIRKPSCARIVRHLEIIPDADDDDDDQSVSIHFQTDATLDTVQHPDHDTDKTITELELDLWRQKLLAMALKNMTNLRSFAWKRGCPPFLSETADIWGMLRRKDYLSSVTLHESFPEVPPYVCYSVDRRNPSICTLLASPISTTFSCLTRFDLNCSPMPFKGKLTILPVVKLLVHHCPYLVILKIDIAITIKNQHVQTFFGELFIEGRWPQLRILSLKGAPVLGNPDMKIALRSFLSFHRNLQCLDCCCFKNWDKEDLDINLPHNSLSKLSSLAGDKFLVKAILSCPCSRPRPLRELFGVALDRFFWENPVYVQNIDKDSLQSVKLSGIQGVIDIQFLGESFPNIKFLDVRDVKTATILWEDKLTTQIPLAKRYPFPNLEILYGVSWLQVDHAECDRRVEWLYHVFPRLEYCIPMFCQFMQVAHIVRQPWPDHPPHPPTNLEYFSPFTTHPGWYDEE